MLLTTDLQLVLRLRMMGAMSLLLYAFMVWGEAAFAAG
jgi:hypothetical protein